MLDADFNWLWRPSNWFAAHEWHACCFRWNVWLSCPLFNLAFGVGPFKRCPHKEGQP